MSNITDLALFDLSFGDVAIINKIMKWMEQDETVAM